MNNLSHPMPRRTALWVLLWWLLQQSLLPLVLQWLPFSLSMTQKNLALWTAGFLVTLGLSLAFFSRELRSAAEQWPRFFHSVLFGFCGCWSASYFVDSILLQLLPGLLNLNDLNIYLMLEEAGVWVSFATVCLVPVSEELVFRGAVFGSLRQKNRVLAYALSAALFSAVHILGYIGSIPFSYTVGCFVQYLPAGLCLAWAYEKSDSIAAPILIHSIVNFLGLIGNL